MIKWPKGYQASDKERLVLVFYVDLACALNAFMFPFPAVVKIYASVVECFSHLMFIAPISSYNESSVKHPVSVNWLSFRALVV